MTILSSKVCCFVCKAGCHGAQEWQGGGGWLKRGWPILEQRWYAGHTLSDSLTGMSTTYPTADYRDITEYTDYVGEPSDLVLLEINVYDFIC